MKIKTFGYLCMIIMLFAFIVPFFMCAGCKKTILNYNNYVVKNWENYTSICGGFVLKNQSHSARNVVYADEEIKEAKLIGITQDNVCQTIVLQNGDQEEEIIYNLRAFAGFKNFTFLVYTTNFVEKISSEIGCYSSEDYIYLLDNRTGKIFYVNDNFERINVYTIGVYGESTNSMFVVGKMKGEDIVGNYGENIYKLTIVNNELEVRKVLDTDSFSQFGIEYIVDTYGNLFSKRNKYMIKANGTIVLRPNGEIFKAMNGFVYLDNGQDKKIFDESGNLKDTNFKPENINFSGCGVVPGGNDDTFLIKRIDNVEYYYINRTGESFYNSEGLSTTPDKIYKVTYNNDEAKSYSIETIFLEDYGTAGCELVISNDKIYFISESQIYYINIFNGTKTILNCEYFFDHIWNDNQGNVCFSGIDQNMNTVNGIINKDNEIDINFIKNNYEVVYIQSIN